MRRRPGPLAQREYRLLFGAQTISSAGNAFATIALAFAVLELTGSKADLGLVLAVRLAPQVVFILAGGVWADRLPRHRVMFVSDLVSAASQGGLAASLRRNGRTWDRTRDLSRVNLAPRSPPVVVGEQFLTVEPNRGNDEPLHPSSAAACTSHESRRCIEREPKKLDREAADFAKGARCARLWWTGSGTEALEQLPV